MSWAVGFLRSFNGNKKNDNIIFICKEQVRGRKKAVTVMKSAVARNAGSLQFVRSTTLNSAVCKEERAGLVKDQHVFMLVKSD